MSKNKETILECIGIEDEQKEKELNEAIFDSIKESIQDPDFSMSLVLEKTIENLKNTTAYLSLDTERDKNILCVLAGGIVRRFMESGMEDIQSKLN